jgi:hypothetical protein
VVLRRPEQVALGCLEADPVPSMAVPFAIFKSCSAKLSIAFYAQSQNWQAIQAKSFIQKHPLQSSFAPKPDCVTFPGWMLLSSN